MQKMRRQFMYKEWRIEMNAKERQKGKKRYLNNYSTNIVKNHKRVHRTIFCVHMIENEGLNSISFCHTLALFRFENMFTRLSMLAIYNFKNGMNKIEVHFAWCANENVHNSKFRMRKDTGNMVINIHADIRI